MQLQEIQRFDVEVPEAALHKRFEILARVSARLMSRQASARLRRDDRALSGPAFQDVANDSLGAAVAIDIGGVDESRPGFKRCQQCIARLRLCNVAPVTADRPGAEADLGDIPASAAKGAGANRHGGP